MLAYSSFVILLRMDALMTPESLKKVMSDVEYRSFLALVKVYNLHNNPIAVTFARLLKESIDRQPDKLEGRDKILRRIRNRFHLALFLMKNETLATERNPLKIGPNGKIQTVNEAKIEPTLTSNGLRVLSMKPVEIIAKTKREDIE
eukprot:TRINITY_DN25371_c0_g1_i1.p1 TRINITY_DN25371_c0_g1~~TRINITY_DN25371_c0_g1_i1.p1  ORF type:complete len:146 (+),score=21.21 TRINITY_DN25371_c0_g1_i1:106-543(+)